MKKSDNYLTCDRCGIEFVTDVNKNNFKPYAKFGYTYNTLKKFYDENVSSRYSITGRSWEDIDLCPNCTNILNTLLGLYGFNKLKEVYGENIITLI